MHIHMFDQYQPGDSFLHRLDARTKLVLTVLFILSTALLPDGAWLAFALSWGMVLWSNRLAGFRLRYLISRSFIALPFALAAVTSIFTLPGGALWSFKLGAWELVATDVGWLRFVSILLRSWISVQAAILLTAATSFPDLVHAMRHLRLPSVLVAVIAFLYRYLFVIADEALRLMRARQARSAAVGGKKSGGSLFWRARVAGNMAGQLFLRSYERSDRIYHAMQARGYRGELLTMNPHLLRASDWAAGILISVILLLLHLLARAGVL